MIVLKKLIDFFSMVHAYSGSVSEQLTAKNPKDRSLIIESFLDKSQKESTHRFAVLNVSTSDSLDRVELSYKNQGSFRRKS